MAKTIKINCYELYKNRIIGLEDEREGGLRCRECINLRMEVTSKYAKEHNYDETFTKIVSNLIYYHDINLEKIDDDKMYMVYNTFKAGGLRLLYQLKKADLLAQNKRYHYILEDYSTQKEKILNKYQKNNYYKNL